MRLTLRTLLAYLDGVLDPAAREVLSEKLKASDFATSLVQRVASVMRQPRLSAPDPDSDRGADDPNAMAEYLDSTLAPEAVGDFERACIESDVRLAEAAACHQVLTLVLGSPAEVSPGLREKAYQIGLSSDVATVAATTVAEPGRHDGKPESAAAATTPPADPLQPPKAVAAQLALASAAGQSIDDVPDYLRRGRWRRTTGVVVTLVLAVGFLYLLSVALAPLTRVADDRELAGGDEVPEAVVVPKKEVEPPPTVAENDADRGAAVPDAASVEDDEPEPTSTEPATPAPAASGEADASDQPSDSDQPSEPDASESNETLRVAMADRDTSAATAEVEEPVESSPARAESEAEGEEMSADSVAPPAVPAPDEAGSQSDVVGQALDEVDGLIRRPAGRNIWSRVAAGDDLLAGGQLVNLPTFRSRVMLTMGIDLTLVGRTMVTPLATDEIVVPYGRVMAAVTAADARVQFQLARYAGELTFSDLQSVAAIEVRHRLPEGADPLNPDVRRVTAEIIAVQGEVIWKASEGETTTLMTGQGLRLTSGKSEVFDVAEIPDWIDGPDPQLLTVEKTAREGLLEQLEEEGDVERMLREIVTFRRAEVAALAARSLAAIGVTDVYFGPEGILNKESQRNFWDAHVSALRDRIELGVPEAKAVNASIAEMDRTNAAALFRMLRGFTDEQLASGADADLFRWLDNPQMSMRVLAIETLRRITGETLGYRAETDAPNRRESTIRRWETRLNRDGIRWSTDE